MEESTREEMLPLRSRNRELREHLEQKMKELTLAIESLAMFSPEMAQQAQEDITAVSLSAIKSMAAKIAEQIDEVLKEREGALEDWDSSANIHMLSNLKAQIEALSRSEFGLGKRERAQS